MNLCRLWVGLGECTASQKEEAFFQVELLHYSAAIATYHPGMGALGDGPIYSIFNLETLPDLASPKNSLTHSPRFNIIYGLTNLSMDICKYLGVGAISNTPNSFL